jgi:thiol-disulfide isomerase/thioredoxin
MTTRPFTKLSLLTLLPLPPIAAAGLIAAGLLIAALGTACGSDDSSGGGIGGGTAIPPTPVTDSTDPDSTLSGNNQEASADLTGEAQADSRRIGRNVGERVVDFNLAFDDGTTRSTAQLISAGKPVFMFFFATWCPVCRREMTQLKDIYPEFADNFQFIAIGQDPTESFTELIAFRDAQGHPWPVALPGRGMLAELRITSQSFKIAFDSDGVIVYREGYGSGNIDVWRSVMADLASH